MDNTEAQVTEKKPYNYAPMLYVQMYPKLREIALECGYSLCTHGSLLRDFDLVAIPWIEDCKTPRELADAIFNCVKGYYRFDGAHFVEEGNINKPHNRVSYTIIIEMSADALSERGWRPFIDLSIIPPAERAICDTVQEVEKAGVDKQKAHEKFHHWLGEALLKHRRTLCGKHGEFISQQAKEEYTDAKTLCDYAIAGDKIESNWFPYWLRNNIPPEIAEAIKVLNED